MATIEIKSEFRKREILFLLVPVYLTISVFVVSISDFGRIIYELKTKNSFQVSYEKIDSIYSNYGAARGSISIYIKQKGIKKIVLYGTLGNGLMPDKFGNMDSLKVISNPKLKNYVFVYESNLINKRRYYLIFQVLYIILGILFFYFVRKQHLKVKRLAPYGVDEDFNPLPKPEEKINFNKYD